MGISPTISMPASLAYFLDQTIVYRRHTEQTSHTPIVVDVVQYHIDMCLAIPALQQAIPANISDHVFLQCNKGSIIK